MWYGTIPHFARNNAPATPAGGRQPPGAASIEFHAALSAALSGRARPGGLAPARGLWLRKQRLRRPPRAPAAGTGSGRGVSRAPLLPAAHGLNNPWRPAQYSRQGGKGSPAHPSAAIITADQSSARGGPRAGPGHTFYGAAGARHGARGAPARGVRPPAGSFSAAAPGAARVCVCAVHGDAEHACCRRGSAAAADLWSWQLLVANKMLHHMRFTAITTCLPWS